MSLNIIGGQFRGRLLKSPKGEKTRPTSAILRKSVFDICKAMIGDASFLDLFAGTGAIGLEAISRGAAHATFIEQDKQAIRCIHENIALLGCEKMCHVMMGDVLSLLKKLQRHKKRYDLVYIDPPYKSSKPLIEVIEFLDQADLVVPGGIIFVEEGIPSHLNQEKLSLHHLVYDGKRKFGRSQLHQYLLAD